MSILAAAAASAAVSVQVGGGVAPSVPTNLSARMISTTQINLTWDASTGSVDHYNIYRDNVLVDTSATNSYSNTGLTASTLYRYQVSAVAPGGNQSSRSFAAQNITNGSTTAVYAAPAALGSGDGSSPANAKLWTTAISGATAGDDIILVDGTYPRSAQMALTVNGTEANPITIRAQNPLQAVIDVQAVNINGPVFKIQSDYRVVRDLLFDGNIVNIGDVGADTAIYITDAHHFTACFNRIQNCGQGGIIARNEGGAVVDYLKYIGNHVHHCGYGDGFASGLSFNRLVALDAYTGFHNFMISNVVSGDFDNSINDSDGNGSVHDTHSIPGLIANNIFFMNGGRGLHFLNVQKQWAVNNVCYKNLLDSDIGDPNNVGDFNGQESHSSDGTNNAGINYWINGAAHTWTDTTNSRSERSYWSTYGNTVPGIQIVLATNLEFEGVNSSPAATIDANPQFLNPPSVANNTSGQYATAPAPWNVWKDFQPVTGSPLIGAGTDPRTLLAGGNPLLDGLNQYVLFDIAGNPRPANGVGWNIGAFQSVA